jgi:hypothetical protein
MAEEIISGKYRQRSIEDDTGFQVGTLRYRFEGGTLYIDMIAVTRGEQGKGRATRALDQLIRDTGATRVAATEDGWSDEGRAFIEPFISSRPWLSLVEDNEPPAIRKARKAMARTKRPPKHVTRPTPPVLRRTRL